MKKISKKIISVILVMVLLMIAFPNVVFAAQKSVTLAKGMENCKKECYSTHGWEDNYKKSYWGAFSGHNCTNYAAFMAINNGAKKRVSGNATEWAKNAKNAGYKVDKIPAVGAIAQWSNSQYGHVAYVEEVGNDYIIISEDGYGVDGKKDFFAWRKIYKNDGWPNNFLHLADVIIDAPKYWSEWSDDPILPSENTTVYEMELRSRLVFTEIAVVYDISSLPGIGWTLSAEECCVDSYGKITDLKYHFSRSTASDWMPFLIEDIPEESQFGYNYEVEIEYRCLVQNQ